MAERSAEMSVIAFDTAATRDPATREHDRVS
jgi:hypothetical protein